MRTLLSLVLTLLGMTAQAQNANLPYFPQTQLAAVATVRVFPEPGVTTFENPYTGLSGIKIFNNSTNPLNSRNHWSRQDNVHDIVGGWITNVNANFPDKTPLLVANAANSFTMLFAFGITSISFQCDVGNPGADETFRCQAWQDSVVLSNWVVTGKSTAYGQGVAPTISYIAPVGKLITKLVVTTTSSIISGIGIGPLEVTP